LRTLLLAKENINTEKNQFTRSTEQNRNPVDCSLRICLWRRKLFLQVLFKGNWNALSKNLQQFTNLDLYYGD